MLRWNREDIAMEILRMYGAGEELNYASMESDNPSLLRAACRHFGSWRGAIEFAGLPYDAIRRYRVWTPTRIIERIQELHRQGVDLSWRNVSEVVDPQLAAAATKRRRFGSWRYAIEAAGLDYDEIRRYQQWDERRVIAKLRALAEQGIALNSKEAQAEYITLFAAAIRRFRRWDVALAAAGLDVTGIRLRAPYERRRRPQKPPDLAARVLNLPARRVAK